MVFPQAILTPLSHPREAPNRTSKSDSSQQRTERIDAMKSVQKKLSDLAFSDALLPRFEARIDVILKFSIRSINNLGNF
jgi:hypothetical protein